VDLRLVLALQFVNMTLDVNYNGPCLLLVLGT